MDAIDTLISVVQIILGGVMFRLTADAIQIAVVAFGGAADAADKLKHAVWMTLMAFLVLAMATR